MSREKANRIFHHPMLNYIKTVWLSGGEVTLLDDLVERVQDICSLLPKLKQISVTMNCVDSEKSKNQIVRLFSIAKDNNIKFSLGISLDGIGEIHDNIRGVRNNFESIFEVAQFLKNETQVPFHFECTITRVNCCHLDAVYDFSEQLGISIKFRVAAPIKRLYNEECIGEIVAFSDKEKYILELFFRKMIKNPKNRNAYEHIIDMVLYNKQRVKRCPFWSYAVYLNPYGEVSVCAPNGKILRPLLDHSAHKQMKALRKSRKTLIHEHCGSCYHDYAERKPLHAEVMDRLGDMRKVWYKRMFNEQKSLKCYDKIKQCRPVSSNKNSDIVLIIGWYGTETAGDKLILKEIILRERKNNCKIKIIVASISTFVTRWSLKEMDEDNVEVIPVYAKEFLAVCKKADKIIIGGGPLMSGFAPSYELRAFCEGYKWGKTLVIEGCGIGPLQENTVPEHLITRILSLASIIRLRDKQAAEWAKRKTGRKDIIVTGDPAEEYVRKKTAGVIIKRQKVVSFFLRKWPKLYADMPANEYAIIRKNFDSEIINSTKLLSQKNYKIKLVAMSHLQDDDRAYYRFLLNNYMESTSLKNKLLLEIDMIYSPDEILSIIASSTLNICMRYHSVVIAHASKSEFIAIDYTKGWKIKSFLSDNNELGRIISLDKFRNNSLLNRIKEIIFKSEDVIT